MTGFWDAVASAGPHANNLHLAPREQFFCGGQAHWRRGWPAGNVSHEPGGRLPLLSCPQHSLLLLVWSAWRWQTAAESDVAGVQVVNITH